VTNKEMGTRLVKIKNQVPRYCMNIEVLEPISYFMYQALVVVSLPVYLTIHLKPMTAPMKARQNCIRKIVKIDLFVNTSSLENLYVALKEFCMILVS
jgi:hypothetical protein